VAQALAIDRRHPARRLFEYRRELVDETVDGLDQRVLRCPGHEVSVCRKRTRPYGQVCG
jgi:hypothetical protein